MQTYQITPKHKVLFGLSWRAYDPFESRHGQIMEWRDQGFSWSAGYTSGADAYVGLANESFDGGAKEIVYSGAVLVALNPKLKGKTALVVLYVEGEVCLVGLIDGCVVLDVCIHRDDAGEQRNIFAQRCSVAGKAYETYSSTDPENSSFASDHSIEWQELVEGKKVKGLVSKAKIEKFKSDRSAWIAIAVLLVVALVVIGIAFKRTNDEKNRIARVSAQVLENSPERLYEKSVQAFLSNPHGITPASSAFKKIREVFGSIPLRRAGWELNRVVCELETRECTADWALDSTKTGTYKGFLAAQPQLPPTWRHEMGPSITRLISVIALDVEQAQLPPRESWKTNQELLVSDASYWQQAFAAGFDIELKPPALQAVPSNVPPQYVEANPMAIHASAWSVSGRPWWLSEVFDKAPGVMSLDRLTLINNVKEIAFNAEGKLYVRKK